MSTFLERLQEEFKELDTKLTALTNFINSEKSKDISSANKTLLIKQHEAMLKYIEILNIRIELNSK